MTVPRFLRPLFPSTLLAATMLWLGSAAAEPAAGADPSVERPARRAAAATDADVARLNEEGARLYEARDYRHAVEKFIEAYAVDHDPNLLFNIARCYEELGDAGAAIEKYEEYLAVPGADAQGRLRARESVRALRELESQPASADSAPDDAEHAVPAAAEPATSSGAGRGAWPWVALGAGVASAGFGATLYALGVRDHDEVTSAYGYGDPQRVDPMTEAEARNLVDSGDSKKLWGGVALGLGGALIATSVVLFVTGESAGDQADLEAILLPTPTGPAAVLKGRF